MFDIKQIDNYIAAFLKLLAAYSPRLIVAFIILIIGIYIIRLVKKMLKRIMVQKELDPTLSKFIADMIIWTLRILLFVTFISKLGIETSSFVALLGAIGLTVGLSLQGSLSNFAGGLLIILFEPFRVGDNIEAQGVSGTVDGIQIFVTKIITSNNHAVYIPNGALSNGNITNYSRNEFRRADLLLSITYNSDLKKVKDIIFDVLQSNHKVLLNPAPSVEIIALLDNAVKIAVRPWANNEDFGQMSSEILEECKTKLYEVGVVMQIPK